MVIQHATAAQGNAHGFKVSRTYCVSKRRGAQRVVVFFKLDAVNVLVAAKRQLTGESCGGHSRNMTNIVQSLLEMLQARSVTVIAMPRFLHLHGDQVSSFEAWI